MLMLMSMLFYFSTQHGEYTYLSKSREGVFCTITGLPAHYVHVRAESNFQPFKIPN